MIIKSFKKLIRIFKFANEMAKYDLKMSDIRVYVKLDSYLAEWLVHEHGGIPVAFPKNSYENDVLEMSLTLRPKNLEDGGDGPGEGKIPIAVPYFKYKNVKSYNYLPKNGQLAIQKSIRQRFMMQLWRDLHKFGNIGKQRKELIFAWMEAHGITPSDTNWNTLAKIYQRRQDVYRKQRKMAKNTVNEPLET